MSGAQQIEALYQNNFDFLWNCSETQRGYDDQMAKLQIFHIRIWKERNNIVACIAILFQFVDDKMHFISISK